MTVAELITSLQKLDPKARVVAPFSPNPADINVEEIGGVIVRERQPFAGSIEVTRTYSINASRPEGFGVETGVTGSDQAAIEFADSDAPV